MGEKEAGGAKKEESAAGAITVVLKIDMHCDGCVKKITKSVKKFEGVESVHGDSATNKLTVKGKVDPATLRERIELKTKKKVDLISPQPGAAKKDDNKDGGDKAKPDDKKSGGGDDKKSGGGGDDKKSKEAPVTTVVLKIRLHCDGCTQRIRKIISNYKGVQKVEIDTQKDLVTVMGSMNMKVLQPYLKEKLKRSVEIVPPKKEDVGEKKEGSGGGGEKKEGAGKAEANKMEQHYGYGNGYYQSYENTGYAVEYVHAPQIFSDENPNACSIM